MTSGSAAGSNAVSPRIGPSKEDRCEKLAVRSPSPTTTSSASPRSPVAVSATDKTKFSRRRSAAGHAADASNGHDESEAETVHLSDAEQDAAPSRKKIIKAEDVEDDDRSRVSSSPRHRRKSSGTAERLNGSSGHRNGERNGHRRLANGSSHEDGGSHNVPSSRNRSHLKQADHAMGARSASPSADTPASPTATSERGRASSVNGSRKRKIRDEHHLRNIEPPRQKLKSDPSSKPHTAHGLRGAPASPPASSPGLRSHRRSTSTQSNVAGAQNRRRREASTVQERKQWLSDASSESSASPQPTTPAVQFAAMTRTKRSSHRSMTSPARTNNPLGHPKKNVDKFGATRLARECEKGNLDAVRAAYEAAPEELNQEDFAGFAPIQKAALNGHFKVVEFLIGKDCRTDCHSKEHDTPLIDAVENGHLEVVSLLLNAGVNPHHQNKKGERAVDVLNHEEDNVDEIEQALRKAMLTHASDDDGMSTDSPINTRDALAEQRNDLLYVESTLSNLRKYAAKGDAVAVDHFLSSIAPDTACVTGASRGGHEMVLNLLLAMPSDRMEKDPDPAKYSETPLTAAIGRGHLGILRILLDQDNFNPTRRTKDGKFYWELAEERKGPKWQQEADMLKERFEAYRARKQAAKKRSLGLHPGDKANKMAKPRSPHSPDAKKTSRASPPATSADRPDGTSKPRIKREKSVDVTTSSAPMKKTRTADGTRLTQEQRLVRKSNDMLKSRRRRVVEEDDSSEEDNDRDLRKTERPQGRVRKTSEVSSKPRKDASQSLSTQSTREQIRRNSSHVNGKKEAHVEAVVDEDEVMADSPAPVPSAAIPKEPAKQHTPEPVRLWRIAEAEKEADRQRLALEREQLAAEQRAAEVVAARLRQERIERLNKLPAALKRACEKGRDRPLHFSGSEMGISMSFLPLRTLPANNFEEFTTDMKEEEWILSFHVVGILGLSEPDVLRSFPDWETRPTSLDHRRRFLRAFDVSVLAHDSRLPCEDDEDFDAAATERAISEAKDKFLSMEHLVWVKLADFDAAVQREEWLKDLPLARSTLCFNNDSGTDTPRCFAAMIQSIVTQHQQALLTPPSMAEASPKMEATTGSTGAGAASTDMMDVDAAVNELAPASSGIV